MKISRLSLVLSVFGLISALPLSTHATWWDFFKFKGSEKATTTQSVPAGVSGSKVNNPTTIEELQNRIADLERQLRDAQVQIITYKEAAAIAAKPSAKAITSADPTTSSATQSSGLSSSAISAKIKPAIVLVQTATSSGSGVIIDSQGHILTSAHNIWTQESSGRVIGAADTVTIKLSNGTTKSAKLVGIDEALDVAIVQLTDKSSGSFAKLAYDGGISKGESVYVASVSVPNISTAGASGFVSGTISNITSNSLEMLSESKPFDTGGAMLNDQGNVIGIPNKSSCKVIEDTKNCLKYTVVANNIRVVVPKLIAGMRLYKNKAYRTPQESLVRGQLEGIYNSVNESGVIQYAITNASGDNSFDFFNTRLGTDTDGKIAKLYALKLKQIAESMYQAADFLKQKAQELDVFLINESGHNLVLGDYQRATLAKIQAENKIKLAEYKAKLDLWTKKKNEYDALLAKTTPPNRDYLMAEGAFEESATSYFKAEQERLLKAFSGEPVNIF